MSWRVLEGDARDRLADLEPGSMQTCITSPPYFGLRDYAVEGQIGLEPTPDEFVEALVGVFRQVRRVLRDDGTVWLNLGDSYAGGGGHSPDAPSSAYSKSGLYGEALKSGGIKPQGALKAKDLLGIPWLVAFALRADGWYLRSEIVWAKPNPMPESVTDRPTRAHEQVFLLSKSARYFYDADAVREDAKDWTTGGPGTGIENTAERYGAGNGGNDGLARVAERYKRSRAESDYMAPKGRRHDDVANGGRNKRSVWQVATQPYAGAHFATFPPRLIEPMVLAGSAPDDVVLDPFCGAGTTGVVALRRDRSFVGIELNPEYAEMARERIRQDGPLFNVASEMVA